MPESMEFNLKLQVFKIILTYTYRTQPMKDDMTDQPLSTVFEAAFLGNLRQLGPYLFADEADQAAWYAAAVEAWQTTQLVTELSIVGAPSEDLMATLLYLTHEAGAGFSSHWHHIDWKDTETLVAFMEASAAAVLPQGLQWSVPEPAASLSAEAVFREANQQLADSGHQFYNMDGGGDAYFPVWVQDQAGFEALAQRLGLGLETFLETPPAVGSAPPAPEGFGRVGRIMAWLLLVPLLLGFGVYRLLRGGFSWLKRG